MFSKKNKAVAKDLSIELETFDLKCNYDGGIEVIITASYPRGNAAAAINALRQVGSPGYVVALLKEFSDDESVQKAVAAMSFASPLEDE